MTQLGSNCADQNLCCLTVSGYLDSFEESRAQEQEKMTHIQENIVSLLELSSRVRKGKKGDKKIGGGLGKYALCVCLCVEHDATKSCGYNISQ